MTNATVIDLDFTKSRDGLIINLIGSKGKPFQIWISAPLSRNVDVEVIAVDPKSPDGLGRVVGSALVK